MQRKMAAYAVVASIILARGVGFWDDTHGQSGVAAHTTELHPVLSMRWAGMAQLPASPADTPRPTLATGAGFSVRAYLIPDPVFYGAYATLYARSVTGAICTAGVVYFTGDAPQSFDGSARMVGSSRLVAWTWHMRSSGTGGTATVTCSFGGQTKSAVTSFSIA
jgi:hypothetical protein